MAEGNHANDTPHFNPGHLLDFLIKKMDLPNDGALAKELKVAKPVIDKIRKGEIPVGGSILLWMQEATGISIDELRGLMGDRRTTCRLSYRLKQCG
jgi:hypothetical protein